MAVNNYVKLYIRSGPSFIFPFGDKGKAALAAAQAKRTELRADCPSIPADAYQLSTFARSTLRGVPVVGEPIRSLTLVEAA